MYEWGLGFGTEAGESWVYPVRDERKHKEDYGLATAYTTHLNHIRSGAAKPDEPTAMR